MGAHTPWRAGDDALAVVDFPPLRGNNLPQVVQGLLRRGAETGMRGRRALRQKVAPRPPRSRDYS
jgi:hypothetical protein